MRLLLICLLLGGFGSTGDWEGSAYAAARCGNSPAFRSLCGFVNPQAALSSPTTVSAGDTISAPGNYILGSSGSGNITITAKGVNFDGGSTSGRVLTGRVLQTSGAGNLLIQNLEVNCNFADSGSNAGCIRLVLTSTAGTETIALKNIKVRNSAAAARNIRLETTSLSSSYSGAWPQAKLYNIDADTASDPSGVRWTNIDLNTIPGGAEVMDSKLFAAADTAAAQGVLCFDTPLCKLHNNYANFTDTTTSASGRVFIADAQNIACDVGEADGMEAYDNDIIVNDHRAFRFRCSGNGSFHNNYVDQVANNGSSCAGHVGDQDNGEDYANANIAIYNNTFRYTVDAACGVMVKNITGVSIYNNTVIAGGTVTNSFFVFVRTPGSPGVLSTANAWNNPTVGTIGFTNGNKAETGATLNYCNSGTASGSGTKTATTCP